jgi:hypothetical protein
MPAQSLWREASEDLSELFAAHAVAMGQLKNAPHTAANHFARKGKDGKPIANYADLATVLDTMRPALAANGLSITQVFTPWDGGSTLGWMLVTTLGHKSGQFMRSYMPMPHGVKPQEFASAATYYKRIALCALVGIASEDDDDGEVAQSVATVAAVQGEGVLESRAIKALESAADAAARDALVVKAQGYVTAGQLGTDALLRLQQVRQRLDAKEKAQSAAAPEQPAAEPAAAPVNGKAKRQPAEAAS